MPSTADRAGRFDAVVVGLHLDFDYRRLAAAADAARAGARLLATNDDTTYPAARRPCCSRAPGRSWPPSTAASGATADVAGKPYAPMVDLVRRAGRPDGHRGGGPGRHRRPLRRGARLPLRPGAHRGHPTPTTCRSTPAPDLVAADLAALVDQALGELTPTHRGDRRARGSSRVAAMPDNDFLARSRDAGTEAVQKAPGRARAAGEPDRTGRPSR